MATRKRSPTQREADLAEVARLDGRGWSQRDIAAKLGVCHQQVCYDLKTIKRRYRETQQEERAAKIEEKRQQLREVRKEAWDAWERSKDNREREVKEKIGEILDDGTSASQKLKVVKTIEGRLPENQYLQTIIQTLKEEAELDDLYPTKKHELTGAAGAPIPIRVVEFVKPADAIDPNAS